MVKISWRTRFVRALLATAIAGSFGISTGVANANIGFERYSGANRYDTAVAISKKVLPNPSSPTVYLAVGNNFPDALAGGAAAAKTRGVLLLTGKTVLPSPVAKELKRLKPAKIVLLGGTGVISNNLQTKLRKYAPKVVRYWGKNRYQTAVNISKNTFRSAAVAYIASGTNFPDALSAASLYANSKMRGPVLLNPEKSDILDSVATELVRLKVKKVYILGGGVSNGADRYLKAFLSGRLSNTSVVRLAGRDRYATNLAIAKEAAKYSPRVSKVFLVTGINFPDALSGGPAAARQNGVLLLTKKDRVSKQLASRAKAFAPKKIVLLGGKKVLSDTVGKLSTGSKPPSNSGTILFSGTAVGKHKIGVAKKEDVLKDLTKRFGPYKDHNTGGCTEIYDTYGWEKFYVSFGMKGGRGKKGTLQTWGVIPGAPKEIKVSIGSANMTYGEFKKKYPKAQLTDVAGIWISYFKNRDVLYFWHVWPAKKPTYNTKLSSISGPNPNICD